MKPIIVLWSFNRGGSESHILSLLSSKKFASNIGGVYIISGLGNDLSRLLELYPDACIANSTSFLRPFRKISDSSYCILMRSLFSLFYFLLQAPPTILHVFLPRAYMFASIINIFLFKKHKIIMSRRSRNFYGKSRPIFFAVEKILHKFTDHFTVNAAILFDDLVEEGVLESKISIIYNGILPSKIMPARAVLPIRDFCTIACLANFIPYKGHLDLLIAFKKLIEANQSISFTLKLIGFPYDRDYYRSVHEFVLRSGLVPNVVFIGGVDKPQYELYNCDFGVLVSHEEGFPNAILEMMACSLPIISTDVGAVPEIFETQFFGYLTSIRSPCELLTRLQSMITADLPLMSVNSFSALHDKYPISSVVDSYLDLYNAINSP